MNDHKWHVRYTLMLVLVTICTAVLLVGCNRDQVTPTQQAAVPTSSVVIEKGEQAMPFELTSSVFAAGETIPVQYTCDGRDVSPPLEWNEPPAGTQSLALICDDPDAPIGTWVHWVMFNIPATSRGLADAVPSDAELADGSQSGVNSWGRTGYGGPCPPSGTHRYIFKLYALDNRLDLPAKANKKKLLAAMEGHILAQTELIGVYAR